MKLKLYGYWRSSASWRVRWAFELKKIPYEYIPVNILKEEHRSEEHLARNSMGALPVLEISPGTFLSQSIAILWWMEEAFENEIFLFGKDRTDRYKIIELCELINADTAPLQTPRVQKMHSDDAKKKLDWAKHFIRSGLESYEKKVSACAGSFSLGKNLSAADLFLIPQLYNARRFEVNIEDYPHLSQIWTNCMATAECQKSSPEQQIDTVL